MTPSQIPWVVSVVLGLIIPWVTVHIKNQQVQTVANLALSTLSGVVATVVVDASTFGEFNVANYLAAIFVAWLATMRSHYTELPQITTGRHEDKGDTRRVVQKGSPQV